ncbi:DNA polymerase III delta subunit [Motilibacter rhizosphaerae]|uniref:DNA-directed DNA polymerase n=1 Tax=Motilibacter rhizosphaerae TaxID=598652 RepID=A0A4Q7NSJ4_9ACTN|nr:DNA polymerase III subunit delta [Motilibacter rhizosphaerae]RZS89748.1 DNA polymerase III delta subunit [Motilibacter rhizosphaerae]
MTAPPLTLVTGPEELLVERAVVEVREAARAADPAAELVELAAAELVGGVLAQATSPSLFGESRVVVVRGLEEAGESAVAEVLGALAAPADDVALVLLHRGGNRGRKVLDAAKAAGARVVACDEVKKRSDKLAFVGAEFRRAGKGRKLDPDAAEALLDAVGGDLRSLAAACSQLASDVEGPGTLEAVRRYYEGRAEVSGFVVADAVVEGRTGDALVALRWALQTGTDPVPLTAALAGALRTVAKVASAGRAARAADIGVPPWKLDVVRRQARGWTEQGLAEAIAVIAATDVEVKGGGADPAYAVERAVVTASRLRGER